MKVILPGSYDPITVGHLDIIKRASELYDEVYAVAFINPKKQYRFSADDRVRMLALATEELDNVLVSYSDGLVIDYMREHGIHKIVKGYRNDVDLEYERAQAEWNKAHGGYETELIKCRDGFDLISSTRVRETLDEGGELGELLPPSVEAYIRSLRADR